MDSLYKFILRRPFFRGQDRFFSYLFSHGKLGRQTVTVKPLEGDFKICCDPSTWIGAKVIYTGNYEAAIKKIFKSVIKKGDRILDIGANIGFHTLYFAELTGNSGNVIAFEPVPHNYSALNFNIGLNNFKHITAKNIALSNKNELILIAADVSSPNPGAYNLFDKNGDISVNCFVGDEIINNDRVDFIKIDVEGYESFVIDGLLQTIKNNKPKIIFEYDKHYHQKTGRSEDYVFVLLASLGYHFQYIYNDGLQTISNFQKMVSGNILALPNG